MARMSFSMDEVMPSGETSTAGLSARRWETRTSATRSPRISLMRSSSLSKLALSSSERGAAAGFSLSALSAKASRASSAAFSMALNSQSLYLPMPSMTNSSTGS